MKRIGSYCVLGLLAVLLSLSLVTAAQEVMAPEMDVPSAIPVEVLSGLVVNAIVLVVRRVWGERALEGKPHILAWLSVGVSLLIGAATAAATGPLSFGAALSSATKTWLSAQGIRRLKKLAGKK